MKRIFVILILLCSSVARADVSEGQFKALYSSLNTTFTKSTYGDGMSKIKKDFYKNVPEADQLDVLAELIERASKTPEDRAVLANAMNLADLRGPNRMRPWTRRLEAALLAQSKNNDLEIRKRLVSIFLKHPEADHHDMITPVIASLLREDYEQLRFATLNEVVGSKWPESKEICESYIRDNQPEGTHKDSVMVAKAFTNPDDLRRAIALSQMKQQPDAQKAYLSYIALHKDDPNYEVSVDMADRLSTAK